MKLKVMLIKSKSNKRVQLFFCLIKSVAFPEKKIAMFYVWQTGIKPCHFTLWLEKWSVKNLTKIIISTVVSNSIYITKGCDPYDLH